MFVCEREREQAKMIIEDYRNGEIRRGPQNNYKSRETKEFRESEACARLDINCAFYFVCVCVCVCV